MLFAFLLVHLLEELSHVSGLALFLLLQLIAEEDRGVFSDAIHDVFLVVNDYQASLIERLHSFLDILFLLILREHACAV